MVTYNLRYTEKTEDELLDLVDKYAEKHPKFDNSYCESLKNFLNSAGRLTEGQRSALENIVWKYRMIKEKT